MPYPFVDPAISAAPAVAVAAVTTSDSVNLDRVPCRSLWIGGAGDVSVTMQDGSTAVLAGVPDGSLLPIACKRVNATGTNASGESLYKVYGSNGVPTVWAAAAKETTQIVSAAIVTATGGPGASGSATVPCLLEIEGDIFTGTAGSLTIQLVSSAAAGIAPQADSHLEAWVMV